MPDRAPATPGIEDLLLGGPRTLTLAEVAARAGIEPQEVRRFWHTLGLPQPEPDDVAFTELDADATARLAALRTVHGLDERTVLSVVRALGHTSDRLALWQVEALVEGMAGRYALDDTSARLLVLDRLADLAPLLEAQLVHAYRRQLAAIAGRYAGEFGTAHAGADPSGLPLPRAVGFADMVAFTRRTAGLGATDLSDFIERFESAVRDVVADHGGRVAKTIGDAVLFVADDVRTGARIALGLARALDTGPEVDGGPGDVGEVAGVGPVRVGFVWGRVLSRFGDVFGPSVNLAARLTDVAEPGSVLTDGATAQLLADDPSVTLERLAGRDLPGIGPIAPVRVRPA